MGIIEESGKTAAAVAESMKATPLALALLLVNVGFLAFAAFVLGEVAANAQERNKTQMSLIENLVMQIRACRQAETPPYPNPRPKETP